MGSLIVKLAVGFVALVMPFGGSAPQNSNTSAQLTDSFNIETYVQPLGTAIDPGSNRLVEGYAIIHRKGNSGGNGHQGSAKNVKCYGFLATGAKWKTVEPWLFNPANSNSLDQTTFFNSYNADMNNWEDASDGVLNDSHSLNILGVGTETSATLTSSGTAPDGNNEVFFGPLADPNTIAVTTVWGIFSGPVNGRELVEWDMVFNSSYTWSLASNPTAMIFDNIATHELGHAFGLSDQYSSSCAQVTMYGYASDGETNKISLEPADITGISSLY